MKLQLVTPERLVAKCIEPEGAPTLFNGPA